jgi:EcsC family protein
MNHHSIIEPSTAPLGEVWPTKGQQAVELSNDWESNSPAEVGQGNKVASAAGSLIEQLLSLGIGGAGSFKGAVAVAEEHRRNAVDGEQALGQLVATHVRLAAVSGFVTGLGGLLTMPVTVPAGVMGLYVTGTRMSGAIAHLRGYDVGSEQVRSVILLSLLGSAGAEALKKAGITIGEKMLLQGLNKVPGRVLIKINQAVGFRLLTKFGQKGVINLHKAVPFVGGPIGAAFDAAACRSIANYAKNAFPAVAVDTLASYSS